MGCKGQDDKMKIYPMRKAFTRVNVDTPDNVYKRN